MNCDPGPLNLCDAQKPNPYIAQDDYLITCILFEITTKDTRARLTRLVDYSHLA